MSMTGPIAGAVLALLYGCAPLSQPPTLEVAMADPQEVRIVDPPDLPPARPPPATDDWTLTIVTYDGTRSKTAGLTLAQCSRAREVAVTTHRRVEARGMIIRFADESVMEADCDR